MSFSCNSSVAAWIFQNGPNVVGPHDCISRVLIRLIMHDRSGQILGAPSQSRIPPPPTSWVISGHSLANSCSTAEIAANAPRYRRKSSTFIDGIHDVSGDQSNLAPAQLYSTMSGRLFHSGRIAIIMVGLPARGKT